ncbi:MAG: DNA topoisomerase [Candidatus Methylacidiphilales bacterium]
MNQFNTTSAFKITAKFNVGGKQMDAELPKRFETEAEAMAFLEKCKNATFSIKNLEVKPAEKSPAAPFTTSTLQQEASRKLGYGVTMTMSVAQKLYEHGFITYMRTDSVNLSETAIQNAKENILNNYGAKYSNPRNYTTKSDSAQEAHEAIRPTYFEKQEIDGTAQEKRLYDLIWKRSIASQMSKAQIERTIATVSISTMNETFTATGEVLKFDGFLKVYLESTDDESDDENSKMLPPLKVGEQLMLINIDATERFSRPAPRYTEASLVKKLEELGIGRPSTYAPTIGTVQKRGYVVKEDREGKERNFTVLFFENNTISRSVKSEKFGSEKSKLFPSDIGMVVTDFLAKHFENIMDYGFTASVEGEFDKIARGQLVWNTMIQKFYTPFHQEVTETSANAERQNAERVLGVDPESGKMVLVKVGKYGPYAQIGENSDDVNAEKPRYASLRSGQLIETITIEEAIDLFKLPRVIGQFEEKDMKAAIGRFGPYIVHNSVFTTIPKTDDVFTITAERAIELIEEKRVKDANKLIKVFAEDENLKLLNGRWGPYLAYGKDNYKLPKGSDANTLTFEDCIKLVKLPAPDSKAAANKKVAKKVAVKKVAKKAAKKVAAKKSK